MAIFTHLGKQAKGEISHIFFQLGSLEGFPNLVIIYGLRINAKGNIFPHTGIK